MLQEQYSSLEEIPAQWRHLYIKNGDAYVLRGASQIKTPEDVTALTEALRKERSDHTATKNTLKAYETLGTVEEVTAQIDRIPELELSAGKGAADEAKIDAVVTARVTKATATLTRELKTANDTVAALTVENVDLKTKANKRLIHDSIREAATAAGVAPTAVEDILIIGESRFTVDDAGEVVAAENGGLPAGTLPLTWLTDAKATKLHWFPPSVSGNARGGNGGAGVGDNPWTAENWNMTKQGQLLQQNRALAEQLAKSAGTSIGGPKPAPKK